jgi:general secretion pathway protein G
VHNQLERLRGKRSGQGGFTLIELLIVIVILGILAAIVVFSVQGINNTSAQSACKSDVTTLNTAAESYYAQFSTGAPAIGTLVSAGLLHADATWTTGLTTTVSIGAAGSNQVVITYTPGTATTAGNATGTAGGTAC